MVSNDNKKIFVESIFFNEIVEFFERKENIIISKLVSLKDIGGLVSNIKDNGRLCEIRSILSVLKQDKMEVTNGWRA